MLSPILLATFPLLAIYLYTRLRYYRLKQFAAFPQLKPSLIWGHLKVVHLILMNGQPKRHIDYAFREIREQLGNPPFYLLDMRPISWPMLVICNNEFAEQLSKVSKRFPYSTPKSPTMRIYIHLIGPHSILLADGEAWKGLRKRFNPGFAPQHLMTLLPVILDKTWYFLRHLDSYARTGEVFCLDELCTNLTFDIIGAVTMDLDFNAQLDKHRQSEAMQYYHAISSTHSDDDKRSGWFPSPTVLLKRRRNAAALDNIIRGLVRQKFAELRSTWASPDKKSRSVLALSLQDVAELTPALVDQTVDQLKTFLFAGHDTTSILLQWTFYELSRTPRVLAALRAELDAIFGMDPEPSAVRAALTSPSGEDLVRRMSYTSAVIKEILRLYPPASSARMAQPGSGVAFRMPDGSDACVDGVVLYNCGSVIQRDEAVYGPSRHDFVPERWLGDTDTSMKTNDDGTKKGGSGIPASAWRPFERGPRNCIGQELANIEARVILACAVRRYDFTKVGLGAVTVDERGIPMLNEKGQYDVKEPSYNTRAVTAKPVDGTRMTVKLNPRASTELL